MFTDLLLPALWETVYMTGVSTLLAVLLGLVPAIILVLTDKNGLSPHPALYRVLDIIINTLRSFPFIILMIVLFPLTKIIVGKSIGTTAAIVPLTIGAAPFVARLIENSLKEVDQGVIEAAQAFGATNLQIVFRIMMVEALPGIIAGITLTLITLVGFSAMAGAVGGGGLGDVAIRYGYHRFNTDVMLVTVLVLIALVQCFQLVGDYLYKKTRK